MNEIKKIVGTEKIVIGTDEVKKLLKQGLIDKVFLASNAPEDVKQDFNHYSSISGVTVETLDIPNEEVGVLCRKPFPVAVLGRRK